VTTRGRREVNQDRVCALRTLVGGEPAVLLAVADAGGGLVGGERAADLALQVVCQYAHYVIPEADPGPPGLRRCLRDLFDAASRRVWLWARDSGLGGMGGSTLVCALVWGRHYLVAHAGGNHCYYVTAGGARALIVDHPGAAAGRSPARHGPTSGLGSSSPPAVDLVPAGEALGGLDENCALLACSDGLDATVAEADLHTVLHEARSMEEAGRRLVALALDRGSTDSISVAVVEVGRLSGPVAAETSA
jgi:protein phosphatase